jgi:hypothetical protein
MFWTAISMYVEAVEIWKFKLKHHTSEGSPIIVRLRLALSSVGGDGMWMAVIGWSSLESTKLNLTVEMLPH